MRPLLCSLLWLTLAPAFAAPGLTPAGYSYPLDGISNEQDLLAHCMSGGCWLAGLPGYPSYNGRNVHAGVDLRATLGDTVYAVAPGIVDPASDVIHNGYGPGWTPGYVMLVRSVAPDGTPCIVLYGHTQNHKVKGGDAVVAGQPLAEIGPWLAEEGGPHLHLTIRLGELPRSGWGTPTCAGQPVREGAECASCEAEVEALGYRNPLLFLKGRMRPAAPAVADIPPAAPDAAGDTPPAASGAFADLAKGYLKQHRLSPALLAMADPFSRSAGPAPYGQGWVQTFATGKTPAGALVQPPASERLIWVPEPLWSIYNLQGGFRQLGYPTAEAYDWPDAHAQSFDKALLVIEKQTNRIRLIWRTR